MANWPTIYITSSERVIESTLAEKKRFRTDLFYNIFPRTTSLLPKHMTCYASHDYKFGGVFGDQYFSTDCEIEEIKQNVESGELDADEVDVVAAWMKCHLMLDYMPRGDTVESLCLDGRNSVLSFRVRWTTPIAYARALSLVFPEDNVKISKSCVYDPETYSFTFLNGDIIGASYLETWQAFNREVEAQLLEDLEDETQQ